jgi:integrase
MRNIFDRKIKCGVKTQQETLEHAHNHLSPAAVKAGLGPIGWHTLRHTYRAWLGDNGEPLTVQKELMRRASIQTTLNTYGGGMIYSMREAHRRVVKQAIAR